MYDNEVKLNASDFFFHCRIVKSDLAESVEYFITWSKEWTEEFSEVLCMFLLFIMVM